MDFSQPLALIRRAAEEGIIPGAAVAIGRGAATLHTEAIGSSAVHPKRGPVTIHTRYDMASLTKTMATAMVALRFAEQGRISLADTLGEHLPAPEDKAGITLKELLTHTSGLPAHTPLWTACTMPEEAIGHILGLGLHRAPGADVEYSCLGYILLGRVLEKVGGAPLDQPARQEVFGPLGMASTGYCPADDDVAATEEDGAGGWWRAVVHDENARFLGGVSGNAGLFSTVGDCARFAAMLACGGRGPGGVFLGRSAFGAAVANHTPGMAESRGLGFSLYDGRTLSCGDLFSPGSFGHTGFTGTSLWVDKATGRWVVLLTNAVHFGRGRQEFFCLRRRFHNAVMAAFDREEDNDGTH